MLINVTVVHSLSLLRNIPLCDSPTVYSSPLNRPLFLMFCFCEPRRCKFYCMGLRPLVSRGFGFGDFCFLYCFWLAQSLSFPPLLGSSGPDPHVLHGPASHVTCLLRGLGSGSAGERAGKEMREESECSSLSSSDLVPSTPPALITHAVSAHRLTNSWCSVTPLVTSSSGVCSGLQRCPGHPFPHRASLLFDSVLSSRREPIPYTKFLLF